MEDNNVEVTEEKKKAPDEYIFFPIGNHKFYKIYEQAYGGYTFYKIMYEIKNADGSKEKAYMNVNFARGITPPNNNDLIRIKKGIVNMVKSKTDKYQRFPSIFINEFELQADKEQLERNAFNEFGEHLAENENEDINLDDLDMPF